MMKWNVSESWWREVSWLNFTKNAEQFNRHISIWNILIVFLSNFFSLIFSESSSVCLEIWRELWRCARALWIEAWEAQTTQTPTIQTRIREIGLRNAGKSKIKCYISEGKFHTVNLSWFMHNICSFFQ